MAEIEFGHYDYYEGIIVAEFPLVVRYLDPTSPRIHRYYFWFFGYVVRLPYEREIGVELGERNKRHLAVS